MRILVMLTGGTIGSAEQDGFVSLESGRIEDLLADTAERYQGKISFSVYCPFTIHSEDLSAETLTTLIGCLVQEVKNGYDGIIVTHGTDTLQYSAAAAAYCLGSNTVPVVFVSSNYPLADPRANGALNLAAAVAFLQAGAGRGVYVAYSNDLRTVSLHYAERVKNYPELSDQIFCVGKPPAYYENGELHRSKQPDALPRETGLGAVCFCKDPKILTLPATPFLWDSVDPSGYRAVVITPYHSGTLPTGQSEFVRFCKRCSEAGVPVFVPDVPNSTPYVSTREYKQLGLIALPEMPQIALYVKLWCAVSLGQEVCTFITKPLGRESEN